MFLPPADILCSTYLMRYGSNGGTCFCVRIDTQEYLVTARHNAENIQSGDSIQIRHNNDWRSITVDVIRCENDLVDIIALVLHIPLRNHNYNLETQGTYHLGQDVFIVGFPERFIKLGISDNSDINDGYPVPFVKKCVVSSFGKKDGVYYLCLDVVANKGFSGGPVFYFHGTKFAVAGVVSKHLFDNKPIFKKMGAGETQELHEEAHMYADISYAHGINLMVEAIKAKNNPSSLE